ncbi:MAG: DUF6285 domain-containing protein, partial [Pseudomonadales bacterium]
MGLVDQRLGQSGIAQIGLQCAISQDDDDHTLKRVLCERLRDGSIDLADGALQAYLRYATLTQALIDQPQYSG